MPTLHILNKASLENSAAMDCLRLLADNDAIVLIEDAAYLSLRKHLVKKSISIFAVQHDLHTRGLSPEPGLLKIINDVEFVELCTKYDKIVSWY